MRKTMFCGLLVALVGGLLMVLPGCEKQVQEGTDRVESSQTPPNPQTRPTPPTAKIAFEWVYVPAGEFKMGSPDGVGYADERPLHRVKLSAFWMSAIEVTHAQYEEFLQAIAKEDAVLYGQLKTSGANHPYCKENLKGKDQPVSFVSLNDARAFCKWAGVQLPTEAQWEYACRAGSEKSYSWGDGADKSLMNYESNVGKTTKGKTYGANGFGLYDMHGNVWEWTADPMVKGYYEQCEGKGVVENPKATGADESYIIRGGGFISVADNCRSALREHFKPYRRNDFLGFRVVVPIQ